MKKDKWSKDDIIAGVSCSLVLVAMTASGLHCFRNSSNSSDISYSTSSSSNSTHSIVYYDFSFPLDDGNSYSVRILKNNLSDVYKNDLNEALIYDKASFDHGMVRNILTGEVVSLEDYSIASCFIDDYSSRAEFTKDDKENLISKVVFIDASALMKDLKSSKTLVRK